MASVDEARRELARRELERRRSLEQRPGVVEDVAKATGSGLVEGAHGLAGLPGDVIDLTRSAGTWVGNQARKLAGKEPIQGLAPDPLGISDALPGTQDMMEMTGFQPYEPKTTAGEYARTAGQFIPAAAVGGVGGGVRGMVTSAAKYGVAPGLASEAAGQATEGTKLEPYARIVAPMVVGGAIAGIESAARKNAALKQVPSVSELKSASNNLYKQAEQAGLLIEPASFGNAVDDVVLAVNRAGIDKDIQPKAFAAAQRLMSAKQTGVAPSLEDMDILRQVAGGILKNPDANERRIAHIIVDKIDDFMDGLKPTDVIAGDPNVAVKALTEARQLWSQKAKGEIIGRLFEKAKNAAGANYTSAGYETALRQKFRALADNDNAFRRFNPAEQQAILKVVRGDPVQNLMRFFGKFAPRGLFSGGGLAAAATYGGPVLGGAYLAAAEGGKAAATRMGLSNAEMVDALVRSGGAVPPALRKSIGRDALVRSLQSSIPQIPNVAPR